MEFFLTLDIIGDYYTKALQGSQLRRFCNIILGIHEYEIPSYNASKIALLEEQKIKLYREKNSLIRLKNLQATEKAKECVGKIG